MKQSGTLVAACYGKACAPPPVGKGGSSKGGTPEAAAGRATKAERTEKLIKQMGFVIATNARAQEEGITKFLAHQVAGSGGVLFGLDERLKTQEKITQKLRIRVAAGATPRDASRSIHDAIRYTVHYSEGNFGKAAQATIDALRADPGVERVVVKNTWPPGNGSYKGVNTNVYRKDGTVFEIQFHTPQSQAIQKRTHEMYKVQQNLPPTDPEYQRIEREMERITTGQPTPRDAYIVSSARVRRQS